MDDVYCKYCEKEVQKVKRPLSWGWFWAITIFSFGTLFWVYPLYRLLTDFRTRCHVCKGKVIGWDLKPMFKKNG